MKLRLKPIAEQVMVITGASSGIGLTTARRAARAGARVVLAARNADALETIVVQLRHEGCEATAVACDVGRYDEVLEVAARARQRYGGFDTWVNNAGISIFGAYEQIPLADMRRLFETNFWGVVHGSLVAAGELARRGGALINLGSEVSDVALPLQGIYSASKHAVKGFTDSLRQELEAAGAPVSVTLIKPAAIDTMFVPHARNYMDVEPKLPPPLYAPEVVAQAILHAAQHPKRDIYAGGAAKLFSLLGRSLPRLTDKYVERFLPRQQRSTRPAPAESNSALYRPGLGLHERQGHRGHVCESSVYTEITTLAGR
jgi:short-subunit dehydrogenase